MRIYQVSELGSSPFGFFVLALVFIVQSGFAQIIAMPPFLPDPDGENESRAKFGPQVTMDGQGNGVAAWSSSGNQGGTAGPDQDIFVSRSADNGVAWTPPVLLNTNGEADDGSDSSVQVTTDGQGAWVAVWNSDENLGGTAGSDQDIFVSRSTDNGVTWTSPALLNTNGDTDSGSDFFPELASDGQGTWVTVWRSFENLEGTAGTDRDIFVSQSIDSGITWTSPSLLNANGRSDTESDSGIEVITDRLGNWLAVWSSTENLGGTAGTDSDIFVSRSSDNAVTWTQPVLLNTNGDNDVGHDSSPQVTTDGQGNWVAVWFSGENPSGAAGTDADILVSRSTDNGTTWSSPSLLNTYGNADDETMDLHPQVSTDGQGNWLAVWEAVTESGVTIREILVSRSTDNGKTWPPPSRFYSNEVNRIILSYSVQMTTDGSGKWFLVWHSFENLDGTPRTDSDVFLATFVLRTIMEGSPEVDGGCRNDAGARGVPRAFWPDLVMMLLVVGVMALRGRAGRAGRRMLSEQP